MRPHQQISTTATWTAASGRTNCDVAFDNGGFPVDLDAQAGGGQHPSPHEILDSALAACTVLTLQLYAKRKGMKLARVTARVSPRQDGAVYRMQRDLAVEGDLSDADRQSLLRIAQMCPVHKTLIGEMAIETALVASQD
jgi:putative redox protein